MSSVLLYIVNVDWFFCSHRLPIALQAMENGYEVHLACKVTGSADELNRLGIIVHPLSLTRSNFGFLNNLSTFIQIYKTIRITKPDIIHLVTIKPVLFGGFAARLLGVPLVVVAISGLGFIFTSQSLLAKIRRFIISCLYRLSLNNKNVKVIFQNLKDLDVIRQYVGLPKENTLIISGSGVNLAHYQYTPVPSGTPVVMFAARFLVDKGIFEFMKAVSILQSVGTKARFVLVGDMDFDNPASISQNDFDKIINSGLIEYWGHSSDMPTTIAKSTIVVLPSYREGFPKVLMEAAACGRAIVTTDVPGCRDSINPGVTGLLVKEKDPHSLAIAIDCLLNDRNMCVKMGKAGRLLAENNYDISLIVEKHIKLYFDFNNLAKR